ncbi:MAG: hypothetical protein PWQ19_1243 [Tepidiphilus sp.]|jgi:hypothetical protein|uniref:Inner membrane protein YgaP-like transmembrane domain-containing protein n=2 Tax=Hydrogenophilaceae TaxID=206349 RepID=A0A0K6IRC8_9PROT|nr:MULTISPECIES: DUF2892 domain-containing protein [Tepidiphilus]MDK2797693.1 hypothetical protein [Tepidiphilus sp.]CUB05651.1 Protein of unknown function (DUF2892) [Tepidiphilus thermophilus]
MEMKRNVGGIDKIARIVVGVVLIVLALMGIGTPWTWIGVLPLATGLLNWCPLYTLIGVNTCQKKESGSGQAS